MFGVHSVRYALLSPQKCTAQLFVIVSLCLVLWHLTWILCLALWTLALLVLSQHSVLHNPKEPASASSESTSGRSSSYNVESPLYPLQYSGPFFWPMPISPTALAMPPHYFGSAPMPRSPHRFSPRGRGRGGAFPQADNSWGSPPSGAPSSPQSPHPYVQQPYFRPPAVMPTVAPVVFYPQFFPNPADSSPTLPPSPNASLASSHFSSPAAASEDSTASPEALAAAVQLALSDVPDHEHDVSAEETPKQAVCALAFIVNALLYQELCPVGV